MAALYTSGPRDQPTHPAHSFSGEYFPFSTDSRRASCQLLAKEWTLNTGKVPPEGLHRNSLVE